MTLGRSGSGLVRAERARGVAVALALVASALLGGCAALPSDTAAGGAAGEGRVGGSQGASASSSSSAPAVAPSDAPPAPDPAAQPVAPGAPLTPAAPARAAEFGAGTVPVSVSIPTLGLDEQLIDLGLEPDGTMQVPTDFSRAGWFTGGGRPGGAGPTVIAGHIDSAVGPAVFHRLDELVAGDVFELRGAGGETFAYRVTEVGDYAKADFPTARVFGAVADDEARLITCSGVFDRASGHYEDNRVVFATRTA